MYHPQRSPSSQLHSRFDLDTRKRDGENSIPTAPGPVDVYHPRLSLSAQVSDHQNSTNYPLFDSRSVNAVPDLPQDFSLPFDGVWGNEYTLLPVPDHDAVPATSGFGPRSVVFNPNSETPIAGELHTFDNWSSDAWFLNLSMPSVINNPSPMPALEATDSQFCERLKRMMYEENIDPHMVIAFIEREMLQVRGSAESRVPSRRRHTEDRKCSRCHRTKTTQWRRHPETRATLCNSCGQKAYKARKG
ncbi:hypothetical protein R3P38DRAFT_2780593 [Favolaschia claudopus]|uniref:GATA-type domain-containing protein n=1 Tax=Favolaschia claudopus TaxID=2862362 RepID=A0AAW0B9A8_9AGAR